MCLEQRSLWQLLQSERLTLKKSAYAVTVFISCTRTSQRQSSWGQPGKGKISKTPCMSSVIHFMEIVQVQPTHHYKPCKALMYSVSMEFLRILTVLSRRSLWVCVSGTLKLYNVALWDVFHRDRDSPSLKYPYLAQVQNCGTKYGGGEDRGRVRWG